MPILLKRKNGEITPFRSADFIPAFYFIPKSILDNAYMVWPFMGLGAKREIYSGYEPSWIFAHAEPYWIQELQDEKILPTAKELLMNGGVDENFCYVSEEEISDLFIWLVPQAMAHHNMNAVIDTAKEFRCFEDFDYREQQAKD